MKVERDLYNRIKAISELKQWNQPQKLQELLKELKPRSARTNSQNKALHLWFDLVAKELNDAGYTVQLVVKEKVDIDWNKDLVKEILWKPAQNTILKKGSTTKLDKVGEIDLVWEHLNRHLGQKFGVHVDFPSEERTLLEMTYDNNK